MYYITYGIYTLFIAAGALRGTGVRWYIWRPRRWCCWPFTNTSTITASLCWDFAKVAESSSYQTSQRIQRIRWSRKVSQLDLRLIINSRIALGEHCTLSMTSNGAWGCATQLYRCIQQMYEYDPKRNERANRREDMIDKMTDVADKYVVEISPHITLIMMIDSRAFWLKRRTKTNQDSLCLVVTVACIG